MNADQNRKTGTVKWFDPKKAYGFITGDDGVDYFAHCSAIVGGKKTLEKGDRVEFEPASTTDRGPKALHVAKAAVK